MEQLNRKKSPRSPSIYLGDAIERVSKVYEIERTHSIPSEVMAQDLGYSGARNGAAMATMASLGYYGLVEKREDGKLGVSKTLETYKFAPSDSIRRDLLLQWLKSPSVFAELLEKYSTGLPSDGTLKFDLIQGGFAPTAADACVAVFRRSVEFAQYFDSARDGSKVGEIVAVVEDEGEATRIATVGSNEFDRSVANPSQKTATTALQEGTDRIPVRLAGGRRAWLEIPTPFYLADKERLRSQIDLLLTDDEESDVFE